MSSTFGIEIGAATRALFVGVAALAIVGCGDQHEMRDHSTCRDGVEMSLPDFEQRFGADVPLELRACFDEDCDDVRIIRATKSATGLACDWDPGGPPSQLTSCETLRDGSVRISIARVDGRSYAGGASHVVALSLRRTDGSFVYAHAEATTLPTTIEADSGVCHIDRLTFR